ncbi:MAG: type II toxin-antitoxin system VapC family toxin [Thiomargarita sp.]|nr:type II toxin-antitoxin system VapC family toxin [Thiomargarita sp.]
MNEIFADTSGWAEFFVKTEPFHVKAKYLMQECYTTKTQVITTNYVLLELVALLTSPLRIPRNQQIRVIKTIKTAPWVNIIHIDFSIHEEAWNLLTKRQDKTWSLVDCSSFIIMQQRNILEALTTDHHFEQAGFIRLLK